MGIVPSRKVKTLLLTYKGELGEYYTSTPIRVYSDSWETLLAPIIIQELHDIEFIFIRRDAIGRY